MMYPWLLASIRVDADLLSWLDVASVDKDTVKA